MEVILTDSASLAADAVANEILDALETKPNLVLGLATGSTPIEVYRRLGAAHHKEGVDFSKVHTFNLDEYLDLPGDHPQSYKYFMQEHLFDHVNIPQDNIHFPPSEGDNLVRRCREYEQKIREVGGIDIQILGLGSNGHIGFNEPTSSLKSRTRIKTLTAKTIKDNSRFYSDGEEQPVVASTMGIGTIMDTKRILLQAFGKKKAEAVRNAVEGPISSLCPGSVLQLHPLTTFFVDSEAADLLTMKDYYLATIRENDRLRAEGRL